MKSQNIASDLRVQLADPLHPRAQCGPARQHAGDFVSLIALKARPRGVDSFDCCVCVGWLLLLASTRTELRVRTMTTASPQLPDNLLRADPGEGDALEALRRQIDDIFRAQRPARLVGPDGETMDIPASAFHALKLVVQGMACGQTMTLVPHGKELTTQEAADLLHISRPHLTKLLD